MQLKRKSTRSAQNNFGALFYPKPFPMRKLWIIEYITFIITTKYFFKIIINILDKHTEHTQRPEETMKEKANEKLRMIFKIRKKISFLICALFFHENVTKMNKLLFGGMQSADIVRSRGNYFQISNCHTERQTLICFYLFV